MSSHESNVYELLDIFRGQGIPESLTCSEADTVAGLLREYSGDHAAETFLACHAETDEPGDRHYVDPLFAVLERQFDQVGLFGATTGDGAVVDLPATQSQALVFPIDSSEQYRIEIYENGDAFDGLPYSIKRAATPAQVVEVLRGFAEVAA